MAAHDARKRYCNHPLAWEAAVSHAVEPWHSLPAHITKRTPDKAGQVDAPAIEAAASVEQPQPWQKASAAQSQLLMARTAGCICVASAYSGVEGHSEKPQWPLAWYGTVGAVVSRQVSSVRLGCADLPPPEAGDKRSLRYLVKGPCQHLRRGRADAEKLAEAGARQAWQKQPLQYARALEALGP